MMHAYSNRETCNLFARPIWKITAWVKIKNLFLVRPWGNDSEGSKLGLSLLTDFQTHDAYFTSLSSALLSTKHRQICQVRTRAIDNQLPISANTFNIQTSEDDASNKCDNGHCGNIKGKGTVPFKKSDKPHPW
jgi:hypothetical protein